MMSKLIRQCLLAFALLSSTSAAMSSSLSGCAKKDDAVSCYLGLAIAQMSGISNDEERAGAVAYLLHAHTRLARANPPLIDQAIKVLRSKNDIGVANRLDLLLALYEYSRIYHPQLSNQYFRVLMQTIDLFANDPTPSVKANFTLWSCGLFEQDKETWDVFSGVFLDHCRRAVFDELVKADPDQRLLSDLGKVFFYFAFGEFSKVDESLKGLSTQVDLLLKDAKTRKQKADDLIVLSRNMQSFAHLVRANAAMHLKNYDFVATEIASSKRVYRDLDITDPANLDELLNHRITNARLYSQWGDYARALAHLNELKGAVDKNTGKTKVLKRSTIVEFFTAYAIAAYHESFDKTGFVEETWADQSIRIADVSYKAGKRILASAKSSDGTQAGLQFLSRAALSGHHLALHDMGVIFRDADYGVKQDFKRAFDMFSLSANMGFAGAQNNLGDLYENGLGTEKSYGDAIYWYSQAAQQGEPTAYLSLGTLFAKGIGVQKDKHRAVFWLTLAATNLTGENNKQDAINQLKELLPSMTSKEKNIIKRQVERFRPLKQETSLLSDSREKD